MEHKLETLSNCPVCDAQEFELERTVKDFSTSKESFHIVKCVNCGLLFTNPRPVQSEIGAYYKSENYISHTNQKKGLFANVYQFARNRALKMKLKWIERHASKGNLLDYGSGTGEFLNHCKENGWDVAGIEIAEEPRTRAIKNYGLKVFPPENIQSFEDGSFDVITMWHVLEHVESPKDLLETLKKKLKANGILVIAVPNHESYDAQKYQDYWAAWDVPIHFYHFAKKQMAELTRKVGFEMVEILNMPFDSLYVSLLSEEYKTGKKQWISALNTGLKSNQKGKNQNASSLTYILRKL